MQRRTAAVAARSLSDSLAAPLALPHACAAVSPGPLPFSRPSAHACSDNTAARHSSEARTARQAAGRRPAPLASASPLCLADSCRCLCVAAVSLPCCAGVRVCTGCIMCACARQHHGRKYGGRGVLLRALLRARRGRGSQRAAVPAAGILCGKCHGTLASAARPSAT